MREVEFRGKDFQGNWRYGSLLMATDRWNLRKKGGFHREWIACRIFSNGGYIAMSVRDCVKSETIGQFTGLQDKNGKDIYEGDIIRFVKGLVKESGRLVDDAEIYAVEYDGAAFYPLCNLSKVTDSIEIIGNIYDNPELLKGGSHASI